MRGTAQLWKSVAMGVLAGSMALLGACDRNEVELIAQTEPETATQTVRISIGTQDRVINTAVGGATVRELQLLEKHLPQTGEYANVEYDIRWASYSSGPPITTQMANDRIDIGLMGDFPAVNNLIKFQREIEAADSIFIGTLAYSPEGAGNSVVVPQDSPISDLSELKGKTVSVPFGSAAHGMLLTALANAGLDPETDLTLISESPELGGSSLRTGQIDAHADFVPFGELFEFRGFARKIFDGAQTKVPTLHGIVVRSDFAEEHPELVVAYLKAVLEANQLFRDRPEEISTQIETWSDIDKEVVYMFLGPSGLQLLDPTVREVQVEALKNSIVTLNRLGKYPTPVDPQQVTNWIDDRYLRQALAEMNLDYEGVVQTAANYQIQGRDRLTGEAIDNPKLAAQYWLQGEPTVTNFANINNMLSALAQAQSNGQLVDAIFVHDRNYGWKLLANNAYYVRSDDEISAFLLEKEAQSFAEAQDTEVMSFSEVRDSL